MSLDVQNLEKKFLGVSNSQDSIQTLSLWILHHKNHNKKIIQIWLKFIEKEKTSRKLTLFYLANDVIQNAKKKNIKQYLDGFQEVLKKATILVKDEKIVPKILRVFTIWIERNIYPIEFINSLKKILEDDIHKDYNLTKADSDFTLTDLEMKYKETENVDKTTKMIIGGINVSKIDSLSNQVLSQLKDKKSGEQYFKEFTDIEKVLKNAVSAVEKQIQVRKSFLDCLEKSEIFYETQKSEVKIVTNAYKNFSIRVKSVKNKLTNSKNSLPSPLLSPNIDAPSPTNSEDNLILPGSNSPLPGLKSLLNVLNENSSKNNKISSLDKRLSNLMQNIPSINLQNVQKTEIPKNTSSYKEENLKANTFESKWHLGFNQNNIPQQMQPVYQYGTQVNQIMPEQNFYACFPPPPPPPPILTTDKINSTYDYYNDNNNFSANNQGVKLYNGSNSSVQQIKSVISSRNEQELTLNNSTTEQNIPYDPYAENLTTMENFEPADMDLGNSDDEDSMNRSQNSQRVLKVIETSSDANYKTLSTTYHSNPAQLNLQHDVSNLPHSFTHQPQSQLNMHNFSNYHNGKQNKTIYSPAKTFHHDNRSPRWSNNHNISGPNNTSLSHVNLSYGNGSNRSLPQQGHTHYNSNRSWKNSNSRSSSHNNHNKNRSSYNNNHHY